MAPLEEFDELIKKPGPVAAQAVTQRIAWLFSRERSLELASTRASGNEGQSGPGRFARNSIFGCVWAPARADGSSAIANHRLQPEPLDGAYLVDGNVAIDSNHDENLSRPAGNGKKTWFAGG
jgi:hypothetical protein